MRALAVLALGTACTPSSSDLDATVDARTEGGDAGSNAAPSCFPTPDGGAIVSLPGQSAMVTIPFQLAVSGHPATSGGISAIDIADSHGTITMGSETLPAFVYNDPSGLQTSAPSFQGIAVDATRWVIFWPYCHSDQLTWVDYETSDAPGLVRSAAHGTCTVSATPVSVPVTWSAETVHLDTSQAAAFRVNGTNVTYAGVAPGSAQFGGQEWRFWPFAVIDCTTCGGPGDAGWYELHALLQPDDCASACFGIYYLYVQPGNPVLLGWLDCLPTLTPPPAGLTTSFDATWSQ